MINYSEFFTKYPKIRYDINNIRPGKNLVTVTDIFFRIGFIREVLNNTSSYYTVQIEDKDTPELLAEAVYGDANAGWIILLANEIVDPQFDWPMDNHTFDAYINSKYGSAANAMSTIHHYEKVVVRKFEEEKENIVSEFRYVVDKDKLTDNELDVPYDYYTGNAAGALEFTQHYETHSVHGKTVVEVIYGEAISCYDYEYQKNEDKRYIKIIKAEYYQQIMEEFNKITKFTPSYIRSPK